MWVPNSLNKKAVFAQVFKDKVQALHTYEVTIHHAPVRIILHVAANCLAYLIIFLRYII